MAFTDPNLVLSPKSRWKLTEIIFSTGSDGWSIASGEWDEVPVLGIRWNGGEKENGNPQSRGHQTWFILPGELEGTLFQKIENIKRAGSLVSCEIYQPKDYDFGAWKIKMSLDHNLLHQSGLSDLTFDLPKFSSRECYAEDGFKKFEGNGLKGLFVDGEWRGDLYSNGIPEEENPIKIEVVKEKLIQNVLKKFKSEIV